jgi:thymidylate synthase
MSMFSETSKMPDVYFRLLRELLQSVHHEERNERTGRVVRQLPGGVSFRLDLSDGRIPVPGLRKVHPRTAAAEVAWFLRGDQSVAWLREQRVRIWDMFVEDDGETVEAAYGYRWRRHFRRDQIDGAVAALAMDPSNRRIFVSAWDPATDGLSQLQQQRNVPCPVGFTLSIVNGRLHSSLFIRSSDVFVGLPYDVMGHAILMRVIEMTLDKARFAAIGAPAVPFGLGSMHVTLAHPHLYEPHFDMAATALHQVPVEEGPKLAVDSLFDLSFFDSVNADRHPEFVEQYARLARVPWPTYDPHPELVK